MRMRRIPGSEVEIPALGQGTWGFGEVRERRTREVDALRQGISLGMRLIDTAEFYGAGRSERVVADAVADCRDDVFVVTKVWPSHAGAQALEAALRDSLRRLRVDFVDALLLHWPTRSVPIGETLGAMERLRAAGALRFYGVSNFSLPWMHRALAALPPGGRIHFNQVSCSLGERRAENFLLGLARTREHLLMAYSPLAHGRHGTWARVPAMRRIAERRGLTPTEVALAWAARQEEMLAVVKSASPEHVRSNARAADVTLAAEDLAELDRAFPAAAGDIPVRLPPYAPVHRLVLAGNRLRLARVGHG